MSEPDSADASSRSDRRAHDDPAIVARRFAFLGRVLSAEVAAIRGGRGDESPGIPGPIVVEALAEAAAIGGRVELVIEGLFQVATHPDVPPLDASAAWELHAGSVRLRCAETPSDVVDREFLRILAAALDASVRRIRDEEALRRRRHDVRGALAVIAGQCEMLESGVWGGLADPQLRSVLTVARHAERIRGMV